MRENLLNRHRKETKLLKTVKIKKVQERIIKTKMRTKAGTKMMLKEMGMPKKTRIKENLLIQ